MKTKVSLPADNQGIEESCEVSDNPNLSKDFGVSLLDSHGVEEVKEPILEKHKVAEYDDFTWDANLKRCLQCGLEAKEEESIISHRA